MKGTTLTHDPTPLSEVFLPGSDLKLLVKDCRSDCSSTRGTLPVNSNLRIFRNSSDPNESEPSSRTRSSGHFPGRRDQGL